MKQSNLDLVWISPPISLLDSFLRFDFVLSSLSYKRGLVFLKGPPLYEPLILSCYLRESHEYS